MFLAIVLCPDIAYSVNSVSKYLSKHNDAHWRAVKRILAGSAYLAGTVEYGIEFRGGKSALKLIGYSDADFASDMETRRSTTGYLFELASGPITWCSQRQRLVTTSTMESEYVVASAAAREAIWLRRFIKDIGHPCAEATIIFVDNESAIKLVKNPEFHQRSKHIDIRYHYIREKYEEREIIVKHISSKV